MAPPKTTAPARPRKKKDLSNKELESFKDIADDVIESDFVPYACLYDPSTIATKDGELLQTIKITGLGYDGSQGNLRAALRTAIKKFIPDDAYAIWLHTLRRKQVASARTHFPDPLSGKIDEAWRAMQPTSTTYTNELYVSIVRASRSVSLRDKALFTSSLLRKRDAKASHDQMEQGLRALSATTQAIITQLSVFGARLLTTVERDGLFYNEQMEFLEKIINLEERPMPVPERDLSQELTSGEITFGFNAMEVRSADGHRRFAAILTLKEYKESTLVGIDKFLEIPCELIVSQSFDFTNAATAQAAYTKQARYLNYSGDTDLAKWMEIDRLMNDSEATKGQAFGQQQTSIFLIAPSINMLETNVRMVQRALNRLGLIVVREDLRFEETYWSQLPANFPFLARRQGIDTDHLAGFVNLQTAPMGNAMGSPWGPPVSVFSTIQDAPYYFNFHRQNTAHTVLLGPPHSGRTTFAHFLISQARKLPINVWYLDVNQRSAAFVGGMGGEALTVGTPNCSLNPLLLPHTPANREFLALWLSTLIDPSGSQLNASSLAYFQSVIDRMLQLPAAQRTMAAMAAVVREADGLLASKLQPFAAGGAYGALFDNPQDNFKPSKLSAWQIGQWMNNPLTRIPLTGYLLHRLTGALNGTPTLLVLDEGFSILNTPLFSTRISGWCDYLSQQNAAAFIMTQEIELSASYPLAATLCAKAATMFAMPDKNPNAGYSMGLGFTPEDIAALSYIDGKAHHILQKRGPESVVIRVALNGLPQATLQALSGKAQAVVSPADMLANLMGTRKQAVG